MNINVFDFDMTLVKTPSKEEGVLNYYKHNKVEYPYKGWFSKPESLDMNIHNITMFDNISNLLHPQSIDNKNYLLTGRIIKLEKEVKKILGEKLPFFTDVWLSDMSSTLVFKLSKMNYLFDTYGTKATYNFYDDRLEHISDFHKLFEEKRKHMFKINHYLTYNGDYKLVSDLKLQDFDIKLVDIL